MTVYKKSAMQRLSETSDGMELWWDSSPLIFKTWAEQVLKKTSGKEKDIYSQIDGPVPDDIAGKLLKIPYFKAGYEVDGIKKEDFVNQPSFVFTRDQFSGSMKEIEEYVVERKQAV